MAKAYPRRPASPPPTKRRQNRASCVLWLISGMALGVAGSNILSSRPEGPAGPAATAARPVGTQQAPPAKPKFMFEEILSDTEVDIGKAPPPPPPAPRPQPVAPTPADAGTERAATPELPLPETATRPSAGTYVVQAGSFSRAADAERLKAELALLGLSTSVQSATLANGKTTHRVRTGGYASKQEAEKVRALLKKHGKDSLAYPIK